MRIYKVNIEHKKFGENFSSVKVIARTAEEAIKKAKRTFHSYERVEDVELLASAEI
jgi:hypothetical protein